MKKLLLASVSRRVGLACAAAMLAGLGTQAVAQTATPVYKLWSLRVNNQDSAAVRSANVTASTPTLKRFVLSSNQPVVDGTNTRPAVPQYSSKYGEAFAPNADGSGWSSSNGGTGPGGTVSRRFYQQFTVTPVTGATVRVDSLILTSSFLLTSSGATMAVAYSRTGFASDSTVITGGKGPGGPVGGGFPATATLPADGPAPITLAQVNTTVGNVNTYRLALNGATGLTVAAPQTLSIRVYFSCSSSGVARYGLLKDVLVKSTQRLATPAKDARKATAGLETYPNPAQDQFVVKHAVRPAGARINVYAATGQKVASLTAQPGTAQTTVPAAALAKGIYLVEYTSDDARITTRLVKE